MSKKKKTVEPSRESNWDYGIQITKDINGGTHKVIFNYLKENLVIDVDCCENWGYYENGNVSVTVNVSLRNPETGNMELVSSGSGSA